MIYLSTKFLDANFVNWSLLNLSNIHSNSVDKFDGTSNLNSEATENKTLLRSKKN